MNRTFDLNMLAMYLGQLAMYLDYLDMYLGHLDMYIWVILFQRIHLCKMDWYEVEELQKVEECV